MMEHLDDTTLNDWVDGELAPEEARAVRTHLEHCLPCARRARTLRTTLEALSDLPDRAATPERVWAAIRDRIDGEPARAVAGPRRRRFSWVELAAAAGLVGLLCGGSVWLAMGGAGTGPVSVGPASPGGVRPASTPVVPAGAAARAAATGAEEYEDVLRQLEALVAAGRDVLQPETLRTLEASTAAVDRALLEIRAALAEDPGSALLERMLVTQQAQKLRILRQAVTAIESRT